VRCRVRWRRPLTLPSSSITMANPVVVFQTSKGTFEAEIYADKMPITAGARFRFPPAVR